MAKINLECEMCSADLQKQMGGFFSSWLAATNWAEQTGWRLRYGKLLCPPCNNFRVGYEAGMGLR